jgi:hypothetical protein
MISNVAVQERPPLADVRGLLTTGPAAGTRPLAQQRP